jgi:hypothetical protein
VRSRSHSLRLGSGAKIGRCRFDGWLRRGVTGRFIICFVLVGGDILRCSSLFSLRLGRGVFQLLLGRLVLFQRLRGGRGLSRGLGDRRGLRWRYLG